MARDSIKLWKSYIDAARYLPDKERLAYYDALFAYGIYEEEPQLDGVAAAMFMLTKPNIDATIAKVVASKKAAGAKWDASKADADSKQTDATDMRDVCDADAKRMRSLCDADAKCMRDVCDTDATDMRGVCQNREERIENREERLENNPPYIPPEGASVTVQEHPDEDFEAFWSLYPKKKSKGDARKAWKQLKPSTTTVRAIMAKLQELISSRDWKRDNGQFIPYPATWLRAEGWNDEVSSAPEQPATNDDPFLALIAEGALRE